MYDCLKQLKNKCKQIKINNMKTKENALKAIYAIMHPAINFSLVDLKMIENIIIDQESVKVTFVFPFANIPIANALISAVGQSVYDLGYNFTHDIRTMTEEEKAKFLQMEKEGWKN